MLGSFSSVPLRVTGPSFPFKRFPFSTGVAVGAGTKVGVIPVNSDEQEVSSVYEDII